MPKNMAEASQTQFGDNESRNEEFDAFAIPEDIQTERQTYRAKLSSMEAEIKRLSAELRAARETSIDYEAAQLARSHGFLTTPLVKTPAPLWSSTPLSAMQQKNPTSPQLNASAMLDDDSSYDFDDWNSPIPESPTSRLFRTPLRPKSRLFTPTREPPHAQTFPPNMLISDEKKLSSSLVSSPQEAHLQQASTTEPMSHISTPSDSDRLILEHKISSATSKRSPNILDSSTPKKPSIMTNLETLPLSHPDTLDPASFATPPRPSRSYPIAPKNGPFATNPDGNTAPPATVTKLVYIQKTSHWCEQICQIVFILLVVSFGFIFGMLYSLQGPPDWMSKPAWRPS